MNQILTSAMSWLLSFSHFDVSGKAKLCFIFQTAEYVSNCGVHYTAAYFIF